MGKDQSYVEVASDYMRHKLLEHFVDTCWRKEFADLLCNVCHIIRDLTAIVISHLVRHADDLLYIPIFILPPSEEQVL